MKKRQGLPIDGDEPSLTNNVFSIETAMRKELERRQMMKSTDLAGVR